jgi:hypothetical protein
MGWSGMSGTSGIEDALTGLGVGGKGGVVRPMDPGCAPWTQGAPRGPRVRPVGATLGFGPPSLRDENQEVSAPRTRRCHVREGAQDEKMPCTRRFWDEKKLREGKMPWGEKNWGSGEMN